jgi:hypothetical protein
MATESQLIVIIKQCTKTIVDNRHNSAIPYNKELIASNLKRLSSLNKSIVALREKRLVDSDAKSWTAIAYIDNNYACEFTFEHYNDWEDHWNTVPAEKKLYPRDMGCTNCIDTILRKMCFPNGYERIRDSWIITKLTLVSAEIELVYLRSEIGPDARSRTVPYPPNNIVPTITFL